MSSALTILMTCWLGSSAWLSWAPTACSRMRADDVAHHADVDVGLEQRRADLVQHLVDIGLGEAALAAEPLDDAFEAVGQGIEHAVDQRYPHASTANASPARPHRVRAGSRIA